MEDRRKLANGKEIWVIKAGFPNSEVGKKYSDYAYARTLKKYLEKAGKHVIVQAYEEWEDEVPADVVVVLRGHRVYVPDRSKKDCIYMMWVLSHPDKITTDEYNSYDLICMGSIKESFIAALKEKVYVPIKTLLMCVDSEIFYPGEDPYGEKDYDWIFVGNSKSIKRKSVIWAVNNDVPLKIWGRDWEKIDPKIMQHVVADHIANDDLPKLYRNARITVDDHFEDMAENGFINTRILEALCCGLPVISDYSEVMPQMFGDAILYYTDEKSFVEQIQYAKEHYDIVKKKAMDISEHIRNEYSFMSGVTKLDLFAKRLREEQQNTVRYFNGEIEEKEKCSERVLALSKAFETYIKETKPEKIKIDQEELVNFREKYKHLPYMERQALACLTDELKHSFYYYVKWPAECEMFRRQTDDLSRKTKALEKERREKSDQIIAVYEERRQMKEKLQRIYDEKSELSHKLQKTYDEKSEINHKLQITYGEKAERGVEIKKLNKQIEDIKNSRTYRFARLFGAPVRFLRKLTGKKKG